MQQTRIVWRWLLAAVIHVALLLILLQVANRFFSGTVTAIAENTVPQGVRLADWLGYWEQGWGQAILMFMGMCAGISFVIFIVWNIIFAIPNVIYRGGKAAKILFFPAILLVIAAELLFGLFYHPVMEIDGQAISLFVGSTTFYLCGLLYVVPFLISLAFCSPYCIKSFKNWFTS
jgi:hypothetical protein